MWRCALRCAPEDRRSSDAEDEESGVAAAAGGAPTTEAGGAPPAPPPTDEAVVAEALRALVAQLRAGRVLGRYDAGSVRLLAAEVAEAVGAAGIPRAGREPGGA